MSIFETMKNPRSRNVNLYIDCDVEINGQWCPYTTAPDDSVSKEAYFILKKKKVSVSPGDNYDWIDGKWKENSVQQTAIQTEIDNASKSEKLKTLTSKIDALKDKIEFGMSIDVDSDSALLLSLRKERAVLV